ncbi:hypothetical protein I4L69_001650 [Enterococcus faecium]|nr:hypothetical protein [Enterococcus faecium]
MKAKLYRISKTEIDILNTEKINIILSSSGGKTVIDGGKILTESITAASIAANAITTKHLTAESITGDKIKAGTITVDRLKAGTILLPDTNYGGVVLSSTGLIANSALVEVSLGSTAGIKIYNKQNKKNILYVNPETAEVEMNVTSLNINAFPAMTEEDKDELQDQFDNESSDSKLTPAKKQQIKAEKEQIDAEYTSLNAQGGKYKIDITAYAKAYSSYISFVNPLLTTMTSTQDYAGATYRSLLKTYSDCKTTVMNKISDVLQGNIDGLETSGANLFKDSQGITNWSTNKPTSIVSQTSVTDETSPYGKAKKVTFTANGETTSGVYNSTSTILVPGRKYVWSVYLKVNTPGKIRVGAERGGLKDLSVTTEWKKFSYAFTATEANNKAFIFYRLETTPTELYIHSPILVEGTIAPSWQESYSDAATKSYVTSEIKVASDNINLNISKDKESQGVINLLYNSDIIKGKGWTLSNSGYTSVNPLSGYKGSTAVGINNQPTAVTTETLFAKGTDITLSTYLDINQTTSKIYSFRCMMKSYYKTTGSTLIAAVVFLDKDKKVLRTDKLTLGDAQAINKFYELKLQNQTIPNGATIMQFCCYFKGVMHGMISQPMIALSDSISTYNSSNVDASNILSSINLSSEGVKIKGDKIDITGQVTFNSLDDMTQKMLSMNDLNSYSKNNSFNNWTKELPDGYVSVVGKKPTKVVDQTKGKNYVRFTPALNESSYFSQINTDVSFSKYLTVSCRFRLNSGGLTGAGVLLRYAKKDNTTILHDHQILLTEIIPDPVIGKWYSFETVVYTNTSITEFGCNTIYMMGNFGGFKQTQAQKSIDFSYLGYRKSTDQEINSYETGERVTSWTSPGKTTIDGGKIETNTITADKIKAGTILVPDKDYGGVKINGNGIVTTSTANTITLSASKGFNILNKKTNKEVFKVDPNTGAISMDVSSLTINASGVPTEEEVSNSINDSVNKLDQYQAWAWSSDGTDRFTTIYPGENYIENGDFILSEKGEAGKNPGLYPKYWVGYNAGITNPTTSYHAYLDNSTFDFPVVAYNESDGTRHWKGINLSSYENSSESRLIEKIKNVKNDLYFSLDIYTTLIGSKIFGGFYYTNLEGKIGFHDGQFTFSPTKAKEWQRYIAKTPISVKNIDWSKGIRVYIYGYNFTSNAIVYIKNIKVAEVNDLCFTPKPSENLENAYPKYIGSAIRAGTKPSDFKWTSDPNRIDNGMMQYQAWAWSKDGTDRFIRKYPGENLIPNSLTMKNSEYVLFKPWTNSGKLEIVDGVSHVVVATGTTQCGYSMEYKGPTIEKDTQYTFSIDVKGTGYIRLTYRLLKADNTWTDWVGIGSILEDPNVFNRLYGTLTTPSYEVKSIEVTYYPQGAGTESWQTKPKLEINPDYQEKNLIVESTLTRGKYLRNLGEEWTDANWFYTDYIDVTGMKNIYCKGYSNLGTAPATCYYDKNKKFIKGINNNSQSLSQNIKIDEGIAFIRFSGMIADLGKIKLVEVGGGTEYTPSPKEDIENAYPKYIGTSIRNSSKPTDYTWTSDPNRLDNSIKQYNAWAWSSDGTDRFTTVYPNANLMSSDLAVGYSPSATEHQETKGYGGLIYSRKAVENGGFYIDSKDVLKPNTYYSGRCILQEISEIKVIKTGLLYTPYTGMIDEKAYLDGKLLQNNGVSGSGSVPCDISDGKPHIFEWRFLTPSTWTSKNYNGHILQLEKTNQTAYTVEVSELKFEESFTPTIYTPAPHLDSENAYPQYIGTSLLPGSKPEDFVWNSDPNRLDNSIKQYKAWAWNKDGTDRFTTTYPGENILINGGLTNEETPSSKWRDWGSSSGATREIIAPTEDWPEYFGHVMKITKPNTGQWGWAQDSVSVKPGGTYTMSAQFKGPAGMTVKLQWGNGGIEPWTGPNLEKPTSGIDTLSQTFTVGPETTTISIYYGLESSTGTLEWSGMKLEEGANSNPIYTAQPSESNDHAYPFFEGTAIRSSINPKDYSWVPDPNRIEMSLGDKVDNGSYQQDQEEIFNTLEGKVPQEDFDNLKEMADALKNSYESFVVEGGQYENDLASIQERMEGMIVELGERIAQYEFINTYIRLGEEGLLIGAETDPMKMMLSRDKLSFFDGDKIVAYFNNQSFYINDGAIVSSLQIGSHKITSLDEKNTVFQFTGGMIK